MMDGSLFVLTKGSEEDEVDEDKEEELDEDELDETGEQLEFTPTMFC